MDELMEVGHLNTGLLHCVAVAQRHRVILKSLMVDSDAIRSADGILTAVTLADSVFLLIVCREIKLEVVDNLAGLFGQSVFLDKRKHGTFDRSQRRGQVKDDAGVAALEFLLLVARAEDTQEHAVDADRGLDDIGRIALVELGVEILYLFA